MAPSSLAILIGAGPTTGAGVARVLSNPALGNMAVALLARRPEPLNDLVTSLKEQQPGAVLEAFPTDTSPDNLRQAFAAIKAHDSFKGLKLNLAIFSIKNSSKKPFMTETYEDFLAPIEEYVGGAFVFAQESIRRMFEDHGETALADGGSKKGTLLFTGTLGALRCNAEFASYGASRGSVRQLAQALAKELSGKGIHVAVSAQSTVCMTALTRQHPAWKYTERTDLETTNAARDRQRSYHRRGQRRHKERQAHRCRSRGQNVSLAQPARPDPLDARARSATSTREVLRNAD